MRRLRSGEITDTEKIADLYKRVARYQDGIARQEDEITHAYVNYNLNKAIQTGVCFVVETEDKLIGEIHCYKLEPRVFNHILSELTIVVDPQFQQEGIGKLLFTTLLKYIEENREDILRVELIARESNKIAIEFYQKIGFRIEGRLEKRISKDSYAFEADIPMAWFNKNFKVDIRK